MAYVIHYLVYGYAADTEDKKITEKALWLKTPNAFFIMKMLPY